MKTKGLNKKTLEGESPSEVLGKIHYGEGFDADLHRLCTECYDNYRIYLESVARHPTTPYAMFSVLTETGVILVRELHDAIKNNDGGFFRKLAVHAEKLNNPADPVETWLRELMLPPESYSLDYHHGWLRQNGVPIGGTVSELFDHYRQKVAKPKGWTTVHLDHFRRLVKRLGVPHVSRAAQIPGKANRSKD